MFPRVEAGQAGHTGQAGQSSRSGDFKVQRSSNVLTVLESQELDVPRTLFCSPFTGLLSRYVSGPLYGIGGALLASAESAAASAVSAAASAASAVSAAAIAVTASGSLIHSHLSKLYPLSPFDDDYAKERGYTKENCFCFVIPSDLLIPELEEEEGIYDYHPYSKGKVTLVAVSALPYATCNIVREHCKNKQINASDYYAKKVLYEGRRYVGLVRKSEILPNDFINIESLIQV